MHSTYAGPQPIIKTEGSSVMAIAVNLGGTQLLHAQGLRTALELMTELSA